MPLHPPRMRPPNLFQTMLRSTVLAEQFENKKKQALHGGNGSGQLQIVRARSAPTDSGFDQLRFGSVLVRFWLGSWLNGNIRGQEPRTQPTNLGAHTPLYLCSVRFWVRWPLVAIEPRTQPTNLGVQPPLNLWRMDGHHSPWPSS